MGFFVDDAEVKAVLKRAKIIPDTSIKKSVAFTGQKGCDHCTLKEQRNGRILTPEMRISGANDADILMLGEAPGKVEDEEGAAFVGPSGKLLRANIPGRMQDRCAYQNMVRCRPPPTETSENRTPTPQEVHACSGYLDADIASLPLRVIVGIGGTPLKRFLGGTDGNITAIHGMKFPIEVVGKRIWYYPIFHPSFILHYGGERGPVYPVYAADMKRLFNELDRWPDPEITAFNADKVIIAQSENEARDIIARMQRPIAWDIETTGLRPFGEDKKILSSAFSDGKISVAFCCEHPEAPNDWGLRVTLDTVNATPVICHNAAFEFLWLCHRFGLEALPPTFHDTMALARIAQEREALLSLATLSRIYLGTDVKQVCQVDTRRMIEYPLSTVLPYNGLDAEATALLYHRLAGRADQWHVQKIVDTIKSTMAMELLGLPIDINESKTLYEEFNGKRLAAEQKAKQLYEVRQFESDTGMQFNIGSTDHIAKALTEYGKCKLPKTAKDRDSTAGIEKLAKKNPLAACVTDYREAQKLCSTYIDPILRGIELIDGHIHPGYTTMFTSTLRLSGTNMNIQNWPKRKHREIRRQIAAPPGHVFVSIDYGQLEARVMAMASLDRFLCEAIITGYDIHADWRDRLLKIYPEYMDWLRAKSGETEEKKLMKAGRDNIKSDFVFASFFGARVSSCADRIGAPESVMQELADDLWRKFAGVLRWIKNQRKLYMNTGTTKTLTGRVRRSVLYGNEPINTPIQGSAADIVIDAQNEIFELAVREKDQYLLPRINVHDDLTFILPDQEGVLERYIDRITSILVKPRFKFIVVPLMVEVSVGKNWSELSEVAKITGTYHR